MITKELVTTIMREILDEAPFIHSPVLLLVYNQKRKDKDNKEYITVVLSDQPFRIEYSFGILPGDEEVEKRLPQFLAGKAEDFIKQQKNQHVYLKIERLDMNISLHGK